MMVMSTLRVVGSGSKGNTYLLKVKDETLILDLGCRWSDILSSLEYNIGGVQGILVSHGHL